MNSSSQKKKGNLLEDLVACLHRVPGVEVEVRKLLPCHGAVPRRTREMDVLVTSRVCGYPVEIAFSCKNKRKKVGTADLDQFKCQLDEVGIHPRKGLMVSPTGYTRDVRARAAEIGIRLLILEGLDEEGLAKEISSAVMSTVFYVMRWATFNQFPGFLDSVAPIGAIESNLEVAMDPESLGHWTPHLLTHIWGEWIGAKIPAEIGEHILFIRCRVASTEGQSAISLIVIAEVEVTGHVAVVSGNSSKISLREDGGETLQRVQVDATFPLPAGPIQLQSCRTIADLEDCLRNQAESKYVQRLRVPRIISSGTYWPPTKEVVRRAMELSHEGAIPSFEVLEGSNILRAWDGFVPPNVRDSE